MDWAEPSWFWLLLLAPWIARPRRGRAPIPWPSLRGYFRRRPRGAVALDRCTRVVEILAFLLLIAALARPRTLAGRTPIRSEGVAILLVLDRSSSMNAPDFGTVEGRPVTRLESARETIARFVAGRPNDLIGLELFAGRPSLACPPTLDRSFVVDTVRSVRTAKAGDDGTNVGDALIWGADALHETPAKSRRLILLSDGRHSPQRRADHEPADPIDAARLAAELGIKIDTIAVGSAGGMIRERDARSNVDLVDEVGGPDVELLDRIARIGGGLSLRAADDGALGRAFAAIDAEEKSNFRDTVSTRYDEKAPLFATGSAAAGVVVLLLRAGRAGRLP